MSNQSFNSTKLRELLTETHVAYQNATTTTRDLSFVGPKAFKSWLREEFKLMIIFVKNAAKCGIINSEDDPFGQVLNDCVTLKICTHAQHLSYR